MNIDEINSAIHSMSKEDLDEVVAESRRLILAGDLETMAEVQESAIHQLILRLATLLPDDPMVKLCVRVLDSDKDAMVRLNEVMFTKILSNATPAEVDEKKP